MAVRVIPCCCFHDGAVGGPRQQQMQPAFLNQAAAPPQAEQQEPGYYEYPGPLVEFPDQEYPETDAAEYPDQALLCPDDQEYTEGWYPVEGDLDGAGFEG